MRAPDDQVAAWHWPSSVSPMVDGELLEQIRERESPAYFAREFLAEWSDPAGAYFTAAELEDAVEDFELVDPLSDAVADLGVVVGGVDWGMARDAHALTVIAAKPGVEGVDERGRQRYWVPWVEERFALSYERWIDHLVGVADRFAFSSITSETNGVGAMPSEVLRRRLWETLGRDVVDPVATTARLKEDAFGFIKLLLQQDRLALPRHPGLLRQLAALEFQQTESGLLKISVPERAGHDDLAMSAALSILPLMAGESLPKILGVFEMEDLDPELEDHLSADGTTWSISPY